MLPFASLCLPDNIIPIPEAGIKNLQFFYISTLCASLLISLPQSTCLIKLKPEFRVIFIRGVTFWLQKIKKTKPITTTTTPRCRLYPTVVTNEGDPYSFFYLYPRLKHKTKSEQCSFFWVSFKTLHWNVKVDAFKSHNRCREMAVLAAVLDKRWVA